MSDALALDANASLTITSMPQLRGASCDTAPSVWIEMTSLPPAGWFPDPDDSSQVRYWGGSEWTEHRAPAVVTNPVNPVLPAKAVKPTRPEKATKAVRATNGRSATDDEYEVIVSEILERAVACAARRDITGEERQLFILNAEVLRLRRRPGAVAMELRLAQMRQQGLLSSKINVGTVKSETQSSWMARTGKMLGNRKGDPNQIYEDRAIQNGSAHAFDEHTTAQVYLDGQIQVTNTAYLLHVEKERTDLRQADFQIGGHNWSMKVPISPNDVPSARVLAERVNRMVKANPLKRAVVASPTPSAAATSSPVKPDMLAQLERLGALREAGTLSEEEFQALKTRLISEA